MPLHSGMCDAINYSVSEGQEETPVNLIGYKVVVGIVTNQVFTFTYDSFALR